jgi:hypothetical protein
MKSMEPNNRRCKLADEIREAFPASPIPSQIISEELLYDSERQEIVDAFSGRSWHELSTEELRYHDIALSCYTPRGFAYYLPAYLLAIVDDLERADILVDGTLYHLRPRAGFTEKLRARMEALSSQQRQAVAHFAEYLRDLFPEMFHHDEPSEVAEIFNNGPASF